MSTDADAATSTPACPSQPYRQPRPYGGKAGEDVDQWLTHYERVSKSNKWDANDRLTNVVFSLTDTALVWYENHEDALTTWSIFVEELKSCFSDAAAKKKRAEFTLAQRAQLSGETCTAYIEEILKLCKTVNPCMSEEDKVGHLLKGIAEDVYNFLIGKDNLSSVSDVIRHCRTFETLKMRRITTKFGRLSNVATVATIDVSSSSDLASTIRQIVREELLRREELTSSPPRFASACSAQDPSMPGPVPAWQSVNATDVRYHTEVPRPMAPPSLRSDYQPRPRFPRRYRRPATGYDTEPEGVAYSPYPDMPDYLDETRVQRPPSPVCYNCGVPGHIARFCERRQSSRYERSSAGTRRNDGHTGSRWPAHTTSRDNFAQRSFRNTSPASDRSLTPPSGPRPRRSPSPRRRVPSPPPEN